MIVKGWVFADVLQSFLPDGSAVAVPLTDLHKENGLE